MSTGGTLFWAGVVVVGVVMIAPGLDRVRAPQPVAEAADAPKPEDQVEVQVGNGYVSQELARSSDGHFYADAMVNGARIRFMVDTGATFVALTREDAQRAGILIGSDRAEAMGAGGAFEVTPVTIDRIAIGALAATDVQGAVADELSVSLLGQSFLSRVGTVEIRGDRMVMR
jgi:aspartyl protease family protein